LKISSVRGMGSKVQKIKLVQVIAEKDAIGGGPKHVLGLLENIDKDKFETYLICPRGELSKLVDSRFRGNDKTGVKTINVEMSSKFSLGAVLKIKKELAKIQADHDPFQTMIVHSHGPRGGLLARKALPAGVLSVYTEHIWGPGYHLEDKINEWAQKKTLRALNCRTNLIIAVSKAVRNYLVNEKLVPEDRIVVIPNGIDTKNFQFPISNFQLRKRNYSNQIIGNIGSLNQMKGQAYLVAAMDEVVKHYPHAMLEIVGEGDERENIEREIKELGLEKHITLLGRRADVEKIMADWSVFVLPSIAETFGITILEAYAVGVPVVASNISGISELVTNKKTGILTEPEDTAAIAESIIKLLEHPAEAARLARGGKEKVREYEWGKVIKKMEEEYFCLATLNLKS